MTNYNDGKWHGHNGGECPVHPDAVVEAVWITDDGPTTYQGEAEFVDWEYKPNPVVAFRVIKEHKEPREFWLWYGRTFANKDDAMRQYISDTAHDHTLRGKEKPIHVREVSQ